MDFDLSADQQALGEAAGALLDKLADAHALRRRVGPGTVVGTLPGAGEGGHDAGLDAPRGFDAALWSAMAEQGWLAVERAEEQGGLGLSMVEVAVLCEQLGRHVAPAPFLETVLAHEAVVDRARGSGVEQLDELAGRLAAGQAIGTVAFSTDPDAVSVEESGGQVTLTGRPDPVVFGASADVVVVPARDELFAVMVPEGRRPVPEPAMDRTRELAWLVLDHQPAVRLGGSEEATRVLDRAATGVAAQLLGASQRALDMAVDYAKERVQFNKPIGSFQAVKHKLADALVDVEGMRSTAYYAAWCVAAADPEASLAASMAKAWCADASRRVMATCLQVHGGIGFTWEHDLHLYVKRAQLDQVSFGDAAWHRERLAGFLRGRLAERQSVL